MGNSRLDNIQNKSHKVEAQTQAFFEEVALDILAVRIKAKRNNAWAKARILVNPITGECVTDKEGKRLTLGDMSKTWYSRVGARNNAFQTVKRLERAQFFKCDLKKYRPKFITLTFAGIGESWKADSAIQKFLNALRTWAKRRGVEVMPYFWASEVQGRGALHYHILILGAPFLSKKLLASWWAHGFLDIRQVDDMGRAFKYLAKYLWKAGKVLENEQVLYDDDVAALPAWWFLFSVFHKRRYGFSKWFTSSPYERLPRWLKSDVDDLGLTSTQVLKARRQEGGGWFVALALEGGVTELVISSPYKVLVWRESHPSD